MDTWHDPYFTHSRTTRNRISSSVRSQCQTGHAIGDLYIYLNLNNLNLFLRQGVSVIHVKFTGYRCTPIVDDMTSRLFCKSNDVLQDNISCNRISSGVIDYWCVDVIYTINKNDESNHKFGHTETLK